MFCSKTAIMNIVKMQFKVRFCLAVLKLAKSENSKIFQGTKGKAKQKP